MVRAIDYAALTERKCTKCEVTKAVAEFNKHDDPKQPINGWRYYSWCRACQNEASRAYGTDNRLRRNTRLRGWRNQNLGSALANEQRKRLKQKYGMSPESVAAMFADQGHKCAICAEPKPLVVDHDHSTGRVRGGLCSRCNNLLGRYEGGIPTPNALTSQLIAAMKVYLAGSADPERRKLQVGEG